MGETVPTAEDKLRAQVAAFVIAYIEVLIPRRTTQDRRILEALALLTEILTRAKLAASGGS